MARRRRVYIWKPCELDMTTKMVIWYATSLACLSRGTRESTR